jgi:GntR family transcriptional regulator of arabinose operon
VKYLKIYNELKSEIIAGKYAPGSKLAHTPELIKRFGVSGQTIRHARKLLEMEGLVKGIPSRGTFVQKTSEPHLFSLSRKIEKVGLLSLNRVSVLSSPYFANIYRGIERDAEKLEVPVEFISCWRKHTLEVIREIAFHEVKGLITIEFENDNLRKEIDGLGLPVVHLEIMEPASRKNMILADHVQGGALAARKLYELGHRKILYFNVFIARFKKADQMSARRWQGVVKEARKRNLRNVKKKTIVLGRGQDKIRKALRSALKEHEDYTGIITSLEMSYLKEELEKRPASETKNLDIISFNQTNLPELVNRKPIWFCKWDGVKMGKMALKTLLDKSGSFPRIQHLPMHLDRNL